MRKFVLFALVAAVVVLAGISLMSYQKVQQGKAEYAALQTSEQATRDRYGAAINEIAAIQDSLNAIVLGDAGVQTLKTQLDTEQKLSGRRGDEAMARISVIKAGIQRTKDKIDDLESKLQASGVQMAGLQKMITGLRKTIAEKEVLVAQLTARVDSLQTQVTGLNAEVQAGKETIQAQAATIEQRRRELGTIYFAIGTKKDLRAAGVIVAKGGVLGLGKTYEPSGHFDETLFRSMDTDQESVINIPSKKAKVLSDQPPDSYELQLVGEGLELRILDAQAFRGVKHVIIMTS